MKYENCICDLKNNGLIILASRPGMGKTTLALGVAKFLSKQTEGKILYFSLVENKEQLETRITNDSIKILDKANADIDYIKNECVNNSDNLKAVIIDYFELINVSTNGNDKIIDELNTLSEQYNIPIVILSVLSKVFQNKKITLNDCKNKYLMEKAKKVMVLHKVSENINQTNILNLDFIKGENDIDFMVIMLDYQLCEFNIVNLKFRDEKNG